VLPWGSSVVHCVAAWCRVLQYVAACCSVVCCSTSSCVAVGSKCVAAWCSVFQLGVECCGMLQHVAVQGIESQCVDESSFFFLFFFQSVLICAKVSIYMFHVSFDMIHKCNMSKET